MALDYVLHEMAGPEKKAMKMLQGSKDVTSAVKNIRDYYERPGKSDIQKEKSNRSLSLFICLFVD